MIDTAHAGREPQPLRRVHRRLRVEDHGARPDIRPDERVLLADALVGHPGEVRELGAGERSRHCDLTHRRRPDIRHLPLAVGTDRDVQAVKRFGRVDIVGEADLQDLDGIDGGAASHCEDEIGCRRPHRAGRRNNARARAVLHAAVEQADIVPAEGFGDGAHHRRLCRERLRRDDKDPRRTDPRRLLHHGLGRRTAEYHAFEREVGVAAGLIHGVLH